MTTEQEKKLNEVCEFMQSLRDYKSIPFDVERAMKRRMDKFYAVPSGLEDAPLAKVDAPSGGVTQDSEARTALNAVITRLEDLGLIAAN